MVVAFVRGVFNGPYIHDTILIFSKCTWSAKFRVFENLTESSNTNVIRFSIFLQPL
eukprot:TRINITY_DN14423_c0_g1_i1.p1 TRINITY_DN14423_c0_g1~~TRINITY_DN14423_c0_g1_i1.p1  ORF type:complete len:56 (-),score=2.55 TRINITY_DN14423_c0_g1_i1:166-333(-)